MPGARPSRAAEQRSDTHSPATPPSTSPPRHDHPAASKTRPTHAPHTTTPQRHTQTRRAASCPAYDQHRSHKQAAWSAPYEPYTTTEGRTKTSPASLPTKMPDRGIQTQHDCPKHQTTLTTTANWHDPPKRSHTTNDTHHHRQLTHPLASCSKRPAHSPVVPIDTHHPPDTLARCPCQPRCVR